MPLLRFLISLLIWLVSGRWVLACSIVVVRRVSCSLRCSVRRRFFLMAFLRDLVRRLSLAFLELVGLECTGGNRSGDLPLGQALVDLGGLATAVAGRPGFFHSEISSSSLLRHYRHDLYTMTDYVWYV